MRFLAGPPDAKDVRPPIAIEVKGVGQKVVRIPILTAQRAFETGDILRRPVRLFQRKLVGIRAISVAHFEIRPFPPVRPINDIHLPVVIEIPNRRPLRPKLVSELNLRELAGRHRLLAVNERGGKNEKRESKREKFHEMGLECGHPVSLKTPAPCKADARVFAQTIQSGWQKFFRSNSIALSFRLKENGMTAFNGPTPPHPSHPSQPRSKSHQSPILIRWKRNVCR